MSTGRGDRILLVVEVVDTVLLWRSSSHQSVHCWVLQVGAPGENEQSLELKLTSSFLIFFASGRPSASAGLLAFSRDGLRDCLCKKSGSFTRFSPL